eukprot:7156571-Alexandrium_andersonii.AAC.1
MRRLHCVTFGPESGLAQEWIACAAHSKNEWSEGDAVDDAARVSAVMSRKRRAAAGRLPQLARRRR